MFPSVAAEFAFENIIWIGGVGPRRGEERRDGGDGASLHVRQRRRACTCISAKYEGGGGLSQGESEREGARGRRQPSGQVTLDCPFPVYC